MSMQKIKSFKKAGNGSRLNAGKQYLRHQIEELCGWWKRIKTLKNKGVFLKNPVNKCP